MAHIVTAKSAAGNRAFADRYNDPILQRREFGPPVEQIPAIDVGADPAVLPASVGDNLAARIDDDAASRIGPGGIRGGAVDADDAGEIFHGAGAQQRQPVFDPHRRPTGDDHEQLGSRAHAAAEKFRKAQVVTDQRADFPALPLEHRQLGAAVVVLRLAGVGKGADFLVARQMRAVGRNRQRLVATATVALLCDQSADDGASGAGGQFGEKGLGGGRLPFGDRRDVHRETGREHFRQHHHAAGRKIASIDPAANRVEIAVLVFPSDVVLQPAELHGALLALRSRQSNPEVAASARDCVIIGAGGERFAEFAQAKRIRFHSRSISAVF